MKQVIIADSTLRGIEQNPDLVISCHDRLVIAQCLRQLNVDIIEAGYPAASDQEFEGTKYVASSISGPIIAALARPKKEEIDRAWEAIATASAARLHLFMGAQVTYGYEKLRLSRIEILNNLEKMLDYATQLCPDVQLSIEPMELCGYEMMRHTIQVALDAGVKTINIPDTFGYAQPGEFRQLLISLRNELHDQLVAHDVRLAVQCHNDLGNALANSLAALRIGIDQVECAIDGFGSAGGICSLEQLVANLAARPDCYDLQMNIKLAELYPISRLVSSLLKVNVPDHYPVVGRKAFDYKGRLKHSLVNKDYSSYTILTPSSLGMEVLAVATNEQDRDMERIANAADTMAALRFAGADKVKH